MTNTTGQYKNMPDGMMMPNIFFGIKYCSGTIENPTDQNPYGCLQRKMMVECIKFNYCHPTHA